MGVVVVPRPDRGPGVVVAVPRPDRGPGVVVVVPRPDRGPGVVVAMVVAAAASVHGVRIFQFSPDGYPDGSGALASVLECGSSSLALTGTLTGLGP